MASGLLASTAVAPRRDATAVPGCPALSTGAYANMRSPLRIPVVHRAIPQDGDMLTLGVILQTGKINRRLFPNWSAGGFDGLYQISTTTNLYNLAK